MRRLLALVVLVAVLMPVLFQPGGAAAQEVGWYGPFDDGCSYWWDGYAWTGDADCSQSSYQFAAADWYGPFSDGCSYWWNGYQYTGDYDCSAAASVTVGWYGPYQDGCSYYWDGATWTGYHCPSYAVAGAGTNAVIGGSVVGGADPGWQLVTDGSVLGPTVVGGTTQSDGVTALGAMIAARIGSDATSCIYNVGGEIRYSGGGLVCEVPRS